MEIAFDCGVVASNVGVLSMALRSHLNECQDNACRKDVENELTKNTATPYL